MALSKEDREQIADTIKIVVNGNIKRIEDKLDNHIVKFDNLAANYTELAETLKPVAEGVEWINTTKKFTMYIGGFAAAVVGLFTLTR